MHAEPDPAVPGDLELTPEERRNGWTRESLRRYLTERAAQRLQWATEQDKQTRRSARTESTQKFDPHRWGS